MRSSYVVRSFLAVAIVGSIFGASGVAQAASATDADKVSLVAYIAKVEPICDKAREQMAASVASFERHEATTPGVRGGKKKIAKPKDVAEYVLLIVRYLEEQQVAVKKETLPSGPYSAQLAGIWKRTEAAIVSIKKNPAEAAYTDPLRPMAKELAELGFSSCLQAKRPKTAA